MAKQPRKRVRTPQDTSKAQHARNPMLAVRVPRSLFRALRKAARDDGREFPDWFRRNAPRLLMGTSHTEQLLAVEFGFKGGERGNNLERTIFEYMNFALEDKGVFIPSDNMPTAGAALPPHTEPSE